MSNNIEAKQERSVRLTELAHLKLVALSIEEKRNMSARVEEVLIEYLSQNLAPLFPPAAEKLHTYSIYLTTKTWKKVKRRGHIQNRRSASSEVEQAIRAKYALPLVEKQS